MTVGAPSQSLDLRALTAGMLGLSPTAGSYLAEAGAVCLDAAGHQNGVEMKLSGTHSATYAVAWSPSDDQAQRTWRDMQVATEHAACGLAVLIARDRTGFSVVERSVKGTGFDYWIGDENDQPFEKKARLEVSGILEGPASAVEARLKEKIDQTKQSSKTGLPGYAVVVEFSTPVVRMASRQTKKRA